MSKFALNIFRKISLLLFILVFLFVVPKPVGATDPYPNPNTSLFCGATSNGPYRGKEFHSLRPYQASLCDAHSPEATFYQCANDLVSEDVLTIRYSTAGPQMPSGVTLAPTGCRDTGTTVVCDFEVNRKIRASIDLSETVLPIMGLTNTMSSSGRPFVHNSKQREFGTLTPAQKMNEFVSWYLNGATHRAENIALTYMKNYPSVGQDLPELIQIPGYLDSIRGKEIIDEEWIEKYESDPDFLVAVYMRALADTKLVIDYSGPLKKLLPKRIQEKERVKQVNQANFDAYPPNIRQDQIVACTFSLPTFTGILGILQQSFRELFSWFFTMLLDQITYGIFPGEVDTDIEITNTLEKIIGPCYPANELNQDIEIDTPFGSIDIGDIKIEIARLRLRDWIDHLPPKPEDPQYQANLSQYWIDYEKWRGQFCASLLPLGMKYYFCFDDPGDIARPNYWGTLFPYIPFSATDDLAGFSIANLNPALNPQPPSDVLINSIQYIPEAGNDGLTKYLYFAHIQEDVELADLLQKLYISKEFVEFTETDVAKVKFDGGEIRYFYRTDGCEVIDSRTGPGDDLFGEYQQPPADAIPIRGDIDYKGTFSCTFNRIPSSGGGGGPTTLPCSSVGEVACRLQSDPAEWYCQQFTCEPDGFWNGPQGTGVCASQPACQNAPPAPPSGSTFSECEVTVNAALNHFIATPRVEQVWDKFVNGDMSIFKRFYPKVGVDTPVEEIEDVPAKSYARYTSVNQEGETIRTIAGDPAGGRDGSRAEVFFPHLGSVYDYFLKGIQKALRPQFATTIIPGVGNDGTPDMGACYDQGKFENYVRSTELDSLQPALKNALEAAARAYNLPLCVLQAILTTEGSRMRVATADQARIVTSPWEFQDAMLVFTEQFSLSQEEADLLFLRAYCSPNEASAAGPFQVTAGAWATHKNAARSKGFYPPSHLPNPCNFGDSVFAAAELIAQTKLPAYGYTLPLSSTDPEPYCLIGEGYYGSCRMDQATCRLGTNYCDYIRGYCGIPGQCSDYRPTDPR